MIEPDRWDNVLGSITGTIYRGTERISTAAILNALGVSQDRRERQIAGKRLVNPMRRLGWNGPKTMRCGEGNYREAVNAGYWRLPHAPPSGAHLLDAEATGEPEGDLPDELEEVTRLGLRKLKRVLRQPTDVKDAAATRNQVTAAGIVINAQLRADEQRLKAKVEGDVLGRLLKVMAEERKKLAAMEEGQAEGIRLKDLRPSDDASRD